MASAHKIAVGVLAPDTCCTGRYEALDRRLDSLESTLLTLLSNVKQRVRNPAAGAGVGPARDTASVTGGWGLGHFGIVLRALLHV